MQTPKVHCAALTLGTKGKLLIAVCNYAKYAMPDAAVTESPSQLIQQGVPDESLPSAGQLIKTLTEKRNCAERQDQQWTITRRR